MRFALLGLAAAFLLAASGCNHGSLVRNNCSSCQNCGNGGCANHGGQDGVGYAAHTNENPYPSTLGM